MTKVTKESYVSSTALYYGDTDFTMQSWNFFPPMNVAKLMHITIACLATIVDFCFQVFALVRQATNIRVRSHGYKAKADDSWHKQFSIQPLYTHIFL